MAATGAMDLTHDDVAKILKIIDEAAHLDEVELEFAGLRLHVRRDVSPGESVRRAAAPAATPVAASAPAPVAAPAKKATAPESPAGAVAVRAPMLGTFYRSPSPGEKPFVEVGQHVKAGDTVCLIEVMKLFNSISAGVDGTVVAIPAHNGVLVEYNQPLVYVMPDSPEVD
jgi:acetyl-CoA carboxylase biotin carboxyl carrier protein